MAYNLLIGEFEPVSHPEDRQVRASVAYEDGGPRNSVGSKKVHRGNAIYPGYIAWREFAERVGLEEVFFGDRWWYEDDKWDHPLIYTHPGAMALDGRHLEAFRQADAGQIPEAFDHGLCVAPEEIDYWDAIRLRWLVYWTEWAIETCEYPTFANY